MEVCPRPSRSDVGIATVLADPVGKKVGEVFVMEVGFSAFPANDGDLWSELPVRSLLDQLLEGGGESFRLRCHNLDPW